MADRQADDAGNVFDAGYDADAESVYECFDCGTHLTACSAPMACPDCGGELRNREMPVE